MTRARKEWWASVAVRRDEHLIKLLKANMPWCDFEQAIRAQEKELMREARTPAERLHIQRLSMPVLITEAYARRLKWAEFGPLLRRCQRLGFADMTHRIEVACCFVQALPGFPEKAPRAFAELTSVEQALKRIRKSHYLRREGMASIVHARNVAEAAGLKWER
ncbi:hypothetical protein [Stigmatella erecta]|uniref:Uncharacterized protein n=1 Tax=Stigmatella erecta TaxID=83460 RepID=A0A1I0KXT5_9BACT|nr:hypothetical protein [Stigmatella erecta]SEU31241.1 hypothetical protein SAMN05443639_1164 [Stigmatella erecta]